MTDTPIKRSNKRIIRRDQLPANKLATTKTPPSKPKPRRKSSATPKAPTTSPSEIRLEALNASLNGYQVWVKKYPLALGIEKQIFQHIAKHQLSCSKRVVKKLLHRHTRDRSYLQTIKSGEPRHNLSGTKAGNITRTEKEHAIQLLKEASV